MDEGALLSEKTYAGFMTFLFDLIADFINRRLFVYERWKEAKQRFDQKMLAFKAHLKKLKVQLFEFNQKHKIMIFLMKLKQDLKSKILSIDSVSRSRKNILALTIMQKKTMKRNQRDKGATDADHQNESHKGFKSNFKFEKNKSDNKFERHNGGATARDNGKFGDFRDNSKSFKKLKDEIDDKEFNCFICGKSKH